MTKDDDAVHYVSAVFVERIPPSHGCLVGRCFGILASFFFDLPLFCLVSRAARPATLTTSQDRTDEALSLSSVPGEIVLSCLSY